MLGEIAENFRKEVKVVEKGKDANTPIHQGPIGFG